MSLSQEFKRLSFFALLMWSQSNYPVFTTKLKLFMVGELAFMATRYGTEAMNQVYGSSLLPVVGNDNSHNFRLFTYAHMSSNPLHNFTATSGLGDCHFPLDLTLIQANSVVCSHATLCFSGENIGIFLPCTPIAS